MTVHGKCIYTLVYKPKAGSHTCDVSGSGEVSDDIKELGTGSYGVLASSANSTRPLQMEASSNSV